MKINVERVDGWPPYRATTQIHLSSVNVFVCEGGGETEALAKVDLVDNARIMQQSLTRFIALHSDPKKANLREVIKHAADIQILDDSGDEPELISIEGGVVHGVTFHPGDLLRTRNLFEILEVKTIAVPEEYPAMKITVPSVFDPILCRPDQIQTLIVNDYTIRYSFGTILRRDKMGMRSEGHYCIERESHGLAITMSFTEDGLVIKDWYGTDVTAIPDEIQVIIDSIKRTEALRVPAQEWMKP